MYQQKERRRRKIERHCGSGKVTPLKSLKFILATRKRTLPCFPVFEPQMYESGEMGLNPRGILCPRGTLGNLGSHFWLM